MKWNYFRFLTLLTRITLRHVILAAQMIATMANFIIWILNPFGNLRFDQIRNPYPVVFQGRKMIILEIWLRLYIWKKNKVPFPFRKLFQTESLKLNWLSLWVPSRRRWTRTLKDRAALSRPCPAGRSGNNVAATNSVFSIRTESRSTESGQ